MEKIRGIRLKGLLRPKRRTTLVAKLLIVGIFSFYPVGLSFPSESRQVFIFVDTS